MVFWRHAACRTASIEVIWEWTCGDGYRLEKVCCTAHEWEEECGTCGLSGHTVDILPNNRIDEGGETEYEVAETERINGCRRPHFRYKN